jgi:hypothetical protein
MNKCSRPAAATRLIDAFGLRFKEGVMCRPHADVVTAAQAGKPATDAGMYLHVRLVPPARPLVVRLQKYTAALGPRSDDDYFFPSPRGGQLHGSGVYRNYRDLLHRFHIDHGGRGEGPRLHDLRHNSESRIIPSAASNKTALSMFSPGRRQTHARNYQSRLRKSMIRSLGR